jgi:hypothetical protein
MALQDNLAAATPVTIAALIALRLAEFLFHCDRARTKSLIAADVSVRFKCRIQLQPAPDAGVD